MMGIRKYCMALYSINHGESESRTLPKLEFSSPLKLTKNITIQHFSLIFPNYFHKAQRAAPVRKHTKSFYNHLFQSSGVYWLGAPEPAFQYSASQISASCHSHSMISPEILLTGLHLETFMGQSESDAARAHCCRRCNRY